MLIFRESIAMREKEILNIGGQLAASCPAFNHNTRQQVSQRKKLEKVSERNI